MADLTLTEPNECESSPDPNQKAEKQQQNTCVNIGVAFPRWVSLRKDKRFQSDVQVACYLLNR